jgi:hypothetical protein
VSPDDLLRMAAEVLSYGAVCMAFGAVLGYVVGPSMLDRLTRGRRSPR